MTLPRTRLAGTALTVSAALLLAPSAQAFATDPPAPRQAGSRTFVFTGAPERFTVPEGVCELSATAYGAAGGAGRYGAPGGGGGQVSAVLDVTAGQVLTVDVGGAGHAGDDPDAPTLGGYGGGGQGGAHRADGRVSGNAAGGGGGRTVIGSGAAPLVVAGGGGGGGASLYSSAIGGGNGGRSGDPGHGLPGDDEGRPGRPGGAGGVNVPTTEPNGDNGSPAVGPVGGRGGDSIRDPHGGVGGGGGGGATGGGGGAASPTARNSGAGGGGGSSTGPADATFVTGSRLGNGGAVLQWGPCSAQPGLVKVEKTDEKTGKPLTGAVFQLWRETNGIDGLQVVGRDPDTRVGSARATDERGRCEFSGLAPGTFYLEETAVPEGYELPDNPVIGPYELTERDPVLAASVSNSRA